MPILRIKLPNQGEVTHELTGDRISVGRRPDNTIQIIDPSISAHHAELISEGDHYRLHDLESTNRTFVDGTEVKDFHLHDVCEIKFGTVACKFDTVGGSSEPRISSALLERDLAFLRGENSELQGKIVVLQRQVDILSSARLVTKKTENTPFAAANDTLRAIVSERDDLRHMSTGLKLELENLRGELNATIRERDAARQACELLQATKVTQERELQKLRQQVASSAPLQEETHAPESLREDSSAENTATAVLPAVATATATSPVSTFAQAKASVAQAFEGRPDATQKIQLPLPPPFQGVANALKPLRVSLAQIASGVTSSGGVGELKELASRFIDSTAKLGDHPISRLSYTIEALAQHLTSGPEPARADQFGTLQQATDLIAELLESRKAERSKTLPHPRVLVADTDADLLNTITATLEVAHLPTQVCATSEEVRAVIEKEDFDLLILAMNMPGVNGDPLCHLVRDQERYRTTPILLLSALGPIEPQVQARLGGNDFLAKPLNTAELTLKAEIWIWKKRFGLL